MTYSLPQKLIAEFIGTFTLVFAGVGAACANQFAGGGSGLLGVALAHGLAILAMVCALGHISGGQFNPAVTAGLWVTRKMNAVETLLYWGAQLGGASAAAFVITLIVPEDTWRAVHLGTPALARDLSNFAGMALEAILTFFLVFVVFGTTADKHGLFGNIAGIAIGLTVTMCIFFGGPFTGAALNPARAFGPALVAKIWSGQGVYWVGPLLGGVVAAALYEKLYLRKPA